MILEIPFSYEAYVRRPRKQNAERVHYRSSVSVDVRIASPDEAPIALRYEGDSMDTNGLTVEMRWFDNSLFTPYRQDDGSRTPKLHRDIDWLKNMVAMNRKYGNPFPQHGGSFSPDESLDPAKDAPNVKEIKSSTEAERADEIRASAEGLLIIKGMLWIKSVEPKFEVHDGRFCWIRKHSSLSPSTVFRLDEAELAADAMRGFRDDPDKKVDMPKFEILIPECLREPWAHMALYESASYLFDDMKTEVVSHDIAYFETFAAMRDTLQEFADGLGANRKNPRGDKKVWAVTGPPSPWRLVNAMEAAIAQQERFDPHARRRGQVEDVIQRVRSTVGLEHDEADDMARAFR